MAFCGLGMNSTGPSSDGINATYPDALQEVAYQEENDSSLTSHIVKAQAIGANGSLNI